MRLVLSFAICATLSAGCIDPQLDDPEPEPTPEPEPWVEPPVAPEVEPVPIAREDDWVLGFLQSTNDDVILEAIQAGEFERPQAGGTDDDGTRWFASTPDESGYLGRYNAQFWYAVAPIEVAPGDRIIARTQRSSGVWIGNKQQPGYVYGDSRPAVPLVARGDDLVVIRGLGGRDTRVLLSSTTDEVYFNFSDPSTPDLVHGRATDQWYGVPLLNLSGGNLTPLHAKVVESDWWEATEVIHPSIGADVNTQIAFELIPKIEAPTPDDETPADEWETIPLTIHVSSPGLEWSYERTVQLPTRAPSQAYWRTFRSPVDGSVQRYGVRDPVDFEEGRDYALFLTLHGAGVQGRGQAAAVSAKDWAYVIAPTNRHPFGFDWEEWGRFNALASLDHAMDVFEIDPTRVYLGGHSMGGHGTWHVGVTTPGRFATLNPSAGWQSFYTYGGATRPTGAFGRARAHSDTINYLDNLAQRGVFVVHGDADTNVPFSEGQTMYDLVSEISDDVRFHWEPGAGHWWDGDDIPGTACVDLPAMVDWMEEHTLDPFELDFAFISPSPGYSPDHSFVTIRSAQSMYADVEVVSESDGATVTLTTTNVRSLELNLSALADKGISTVVVDDESFDVDGDTLIVGPEGGKNQDVYGSFNQAFRKPYCYVYAEDTAGWADAAAYHTSYAQLIGHGHACGVPLSELNDTIRAGHNLIYVGVDADTVNAPFDWSWDDRIELGSSAFSDVLLYFVFPEDGRLSAVMTTGPGDEAILYRIAIWSSRSGLPDYFVWGPRSNTLATGMFTADWEYVPGE
jgi:fermentation-respiration switch protein FrsA (DUF1100 family)